MTLGEGLELESGEVSQRSRQEKVPRDRPECIYTTDLFKGPFCYTCSSVSASISTSLDSSVSLFIKSYILAAFCLIGLLKLWTFGDGVSWEE